jgi:hypothetical protein
VEIQVVEETPTTAYLVLPAGPVRAGQELSDQELEAVAGGWTAYNATAGCLGCASAGGGCG